ncbi:hypothetical protein [Streptosporangium longisporum]|uniref:Uncharacterized protein n=1 Tax=Streptosporangium longisporum TaxID=46187 RepID=A0ABP6LET5_9ACTN
MTFSSTDFEQRTEYERFVLDTAYPLIARAATGAIIDATRRGRRDIGVAVGAIGLKAHVPSPGGGSKSAEFDIRPLIFGAAWKVLDLLIEGVIGHSTGKGMQVKNKLAMLASAPSPAPFSGEPKLWERTVAIYSNTAEMRNCIVHRRFQVDKPAEVMRGSAKKVGDSPPRPVSFDEQAAFCRIVQGVASSVIAQELTARECRQLQYMFDVLRGHHGLGALGGSLVEGPIPTVKASLDQFDSGAFYLDGPHIHQQAHEGASDVAAFDLMVVLADGRSLLGDLAALPADDVTPIDLDDPPAWLRWQ